MKKTINISDKQITLDGNVTWTMTYREQFGHDIVPTLMPMLAAAVDLMKGLYDAAESNQIEVKELIKLADDESFINALVHLSGLEFVEILNIIWSLAATAEDIPEPKTWFKQFDDFYLDEIIPVVFELILGSSITLKNVMRLKGLKKNLQPSN